MTVRCNKPGCGKEWPRDPVLDIACPQCPADVGASCHWPTGHPAIGTGRYHPAREIAADRGGLYGACPFGAHCGLRATLVTGLPAASRDQGSLF